MATPPLAPLEGVTIGIYDRGFADLDEQTQAFIDYRGAGFALISAAAAGTLTHPSWAAEPDANVRARQRAAALARAMQQSRLPHGIETYRGLRAEYLFGPAAGWPDSMVGMEWTDPLYVSTSANSGIGEQVRFLRPVFGGGASAMDFVDRATQLGGGTGGLTHMTIRSPAGTAAVRISEWEHEAEVLLDRGLRYRIVADHGWQTVELREGPEPVRMLEVEVLPGGWAQQLSDRIAPTPTPELDLETVVGREGGEPWAWQTDAAEKWAHGAFDYEDRAGVRSQVVDVKVGMTEFDPDDPGSGEDKGLQVRGSFRVPDWRGVVGSWTVYVAYDDEQEVWSAAIDAIHLEEEQRGEGIARRWVENMEQQLAAVGVQLVSLWDQSGGFWEAMGYEGGSMNRYKEI